MNLRSVTVIGSANMDFVLYVDNFPKPGETIFGSQFNLFPGGKGANQAVACARLGGDTSFLGKLGRDGFGTSLKTSLNDAKINIDQIIEAKGLSTGMALITVNSEGENEIVVVSGANMELTPEDVENKSDLIKKSKVTLCQLEIPIETVLHSAKLAKQNGSIFILNPAPAKELPKEIFPLIDFITPNETELSILTGAECRNEKEAELGAKKLLEKGVKNVIVTLGERGSLLVNETVTKLFPTIEVRAVDTTAAGDTFNGALAYSLAESKNLEDAILYSNYAAALSVTKKGAQASMPSKSEVDKLLNPV